MRLDVSKALHDEGLEIPFALEVALPDTAVLGEAVRYPAPAKLEGTYSSVGEAIHLQGWMSFEAVSRCGLCLKDAKQAFETPFNAVYVLKQDPDNPDLYVYNGATIDPVSMASDAAQFALPLTWRCGEDCKGLCPVCGADQNITSCSCRKELPGEHPLSALQQLLTEDESEV